MKNIKLAMILFATIALGFLSAAMLSAKADASITTDKSDYLPGDVVTVSGSGFIAGELYAIPVIRPDGIMVKGDGSFAEGWDIVTADNEGGFTYLYKLDGIEGLYNVYVYSSLWTGDINETPITSTTFTDAAHGANLNIDFTHTTHYTRTFEWTIDKSVSPDMWDLFTGDSGTSEYTIAVTKDEGTDHAWVTGTITVSNVGPPGDQSTVNFVLTVKLTESNPNNVLNTVTVDTSSNLILSVGETGTYDYSIDVPSILTEYKIIAEGSVDNPKGGNPTSKQYTLTDPFAGGPTLINDEVHVTDTNHPAGEPWTFNAAGSVSYTETFTAADEGDNENTAAITETGQDSDATVTVNIYDLEVTKDADAIWTRTYGWTIDKSADQNELHLSVGQSFDVNYEIEVAATFIDAYTVSGTISIHNPAPMAAVINGVSDIVSPDIAATIDVTGTTFPYTLAPDDTLNLDYTAVLPDASSRTNTATATLQNHDYDSTGGSTLSGTTDFSGTAPVSFPSEPTEIDESITVTDTYSGGPQGVVVAYDDLPKTFMYTRTIGPFPAIGEYKVENTASFTATDTPVTGSDSWTVTVYVEGNVFCAITSKGYQELDVFKLIFTPDVPNNPGYSRLTASNPGQFSFNVFYDAQDGNEVFTISIPYPFVTQGANPVYIYNAAPLGYTPTGNDITSQFSVSGVPWLMADWGTSSDFGDTHTITVTNDGYTGPMYITIHLDYGLKKMAGGYSKDLNNNAVANTGKSVYPTIFDDTPYEFSVSGQFSDEDTVNNMNVFKHDPGIGGLVLDSTGTPMANTKVLIYQGKTLYGAVYTDADGWYMCNFKYTGKPVTFTVKVAGFADQSATLKANGFLVINFGTT